MSISLNVLFKQKLKKVICTHLHGQVEYIFQIWPIKIISNELLTHNERFPSQSLIYYMHPLHTVYKSYTPIFQSGSTILALWFFIWFT